MELSELKIVPQMQRSSVCCFSGNRPHKLPWGLNESSRACASVKKRLRRAVEELIGRGYKLFVSGMAMGGDTYFAETVLELRREHPIFLECAVPYAGQAESWSNNDRARYESLLEQSDYVTLISREYNTTCMFRRNRYMVDKSSVIITLDYGWSGGTASTVKYARRQGLEFIELGHKHRLP